MKRFSILTLLLIMTLLLSACGTKATPPPTLSALELQSTAGAVALTMIAGTQAALPTATPPPPPTATVVNTLAPLTAFIPSPNPTELTLTAAPNSNSSNDPCIDKVLPDTLEGNTVKIRVNNSTRATVNLTVYLNRTIPPIVCGYRAYVLEPGGGLVINNMVEGCFTLWAWNPDPKTYFMVTNGAASCINGSYPVAFDISTRDIRQR